jgi:trk system potassium uptake protein TrkH
MPSPRFRRPRLKPAQLIILSFSGAILLGSALLALPIAAADQPLAWLDALFTITSATCVTGLVVVDTGAYFSGFGQVLILVFIQLGGLGITTLSAMIFYVFTASLPLRDREVVLRTLAGTRAVTPSLGQLLKAVLALTFAIEAAGALLLTLRFAFDYPLPRAAYLGLFHSISAFCNAGFGLFADSLVRYQGDWVINFTIMALIILGGLGFSVLLELLRVAQGQQPWARLSLHTRVVLFTTAILIPLGAAVIYGMEWGNALRGMPASTRFLACLFQSVTPRTAGFNTVDIGRLTDPTLFFIIMLMFIGGASGSCAGGIKVNTFALLVALTWSRLHGRNDVEIFERRISPWAIPRVITLVILSVCFVTFMVLLLSLAEQGMLSHQESRGAFMEVVFEAFSAFGTVGLSTGLTPQLSPLGKVLIILLMFVGRVGPLTLGALFTERRKRPLRYPEENVLVG